MESIVVAEIKKRRIKISQSKLKALSLAKKRTKLKEDEHTDRVRAGEPLLELKEVREVDPKSDEMKEVLNKGVQAAILDKAHGINLLENSS